VKEELKGQVPVGFVVLKSNANINEADLEKDLVEMVRNQIGPIACFKKVMLVPRLPKTRSGKILRKIMRHIADGEKYATPSTIEDATVLSELTTIMVDMKVQ
jgi:propionyl-CoA synthetase